MSHIAVRMLADRLDDPEEGINAVLDSVPIVDGDKSAPEVRIYNETQHGWVARRKFPPPSDAPLTDVEYPCIIVFKVDLSDVAGIAGNESTGGRSTIGTVRVAAQLIMRNVDTEESVTAAMYLLRALRWVVHRYNAPSELANRTLVDTQLDAATSIAESGVQAFEDDSVLSPGGVVITYPYKESVPLPT